jgi:DNA-binding GntR family transcriptional regulator
MCHYALCYSAALAIYAMNLHTAMLQNETEQAEPSVGANRLTDHTRLVYERVRREILDGTLEPGRPISQVRLAAELHVSRTPLREALRLLEVEGLVESDYNRRVRARPLTIPDLEALTAMRLISEPFAVSLTVPALGEERLSETRTLMEEMHRAGSEGAGPARLGPMHRRFHFALFEGVEARLRCHVESLWDQAERYRHIYMRAAAGSPTLLLSTKREHELILDAAEEAQARLCARRVAEHIARTALTVIGQVDIGYEPRVVREALAFAIGGQADGQGQSKERSQ